jgi:cyclic-di-AMP phosphodiesterase PgpH
MPNGRMRITGSRTLTYLQRSMTVKVLLGLLLVLLIAELFPGGSEYSYQYQEGDIWIEDDLIAPFAFSILRDPLVVQREMEEAAQATPRSFDRLEHIPALTRDSVRASLDALVQTGFAVLGPRTPRISNALLASRADSIAKFDFLSSSGIRLSARQWRQWLGLLAPLNRTAVVAQHALMQRACDDAIDHIYARGVVDRPKSGLRQGVIALRTDSTMEVRRPVSEVYDMREAGTALHRAMQQQLGSVDTLLVDILVTIAYPRLRPNLIYSEQGTHFAVQDARNRVMRSDGYVKENERIISRHEAVTPAIKAKIESYHNARAARAGKRNAFLRFLGVFGHTAGILVLPILYIALFRRRIMGNNSRLLLIAVLIYTTAFLAYLSYTIPISAPLQYLIVVPAAAMLLTIIFDSRVSFYTTVAIAFIIGAVRGNDYPIMLASVIAGTLSIFTVRDIRNRTQIFRSMIFIFIGYGFAILVDGLQRSVGPPELFTALAYAFANALLSPVLTFGLLIFFEKVFRISTDLTLLELSDFNHPLLRDLSHRAPGTFHHSIVMGTVAEAAATAIGANAILARVGAYYHDIGKMSEPEYFVENQVSAQSPHVRLQPRDSARRIIDHVLRGMELAREHHLPERVIEFIPAHHGTTLVSYFYEKEKTEAGADVDASPFRYGGPRPTTKETAIVMLADTIEAAARAIEEPTVDKIRALIDGVVKKRLDDGELADCELTFRELSTVKESFLTTLIGIHHSRIKYPTEEEAAAARKLAERTARLLHLPTAAESLAQRMRKLDSL